tara:strand:- start:895 stop:1047 length:153 start_codon:yes stop_codon:yes gene_type:complete
MHIGETTIRFLKVFDFIFRGEKRMLIFYYLLLLFIIQWKHPRYVFLGQGF